VRVEQQNRDAAWLAEFSGLLQTCHNLEEAADVIARFSGQAFPDAPGGVYLFQPSRNYLDRLAAWGAPVPVQSFGPGECWALRRGRPHSPRGEHVVLTCAHARPEAEDALCIPLSAHGTPIGLLHLEAAGGMAHLAQLMAEQLSLALANLKLRETLRDQSIRDELTGLHNRRYLEESLDRDLAAARRAGTPVAVLMLDADHFKRFNDQHGHEAGDAVLRAIGRTLKASVRASDLACRYGGEEFTVVLIGCDADRARDWAARVATDLARLEIDHAGRRLPAITLSMGLAMYPANGDEPQTLLQAADIALYEAKHSGRNRLVAAGDGGGATVIG
jgi:diguanylate cyclase (GGDEF)-like protein